jgi:hypothetical protein
VSYFYLFKNKTLIFKQTFAFKQKEQQASAMFLLPFKMQPLVA